MKPSHKPTYTIIKTEQFIQKGQNIRAGFDCFSEMLDAIDWALQRKPHSYTNILGEYYLLTTEQLAEPHFPFIKVFYKILEENFQVILLDIE